MIVLLTILSALAVLALFVVLALFLVRIASTLEAIGGEPRGYSDRMSDLAKIALGVRAIEQQTGHLGPEVTRLNAALDQAAAGLRAIDGQLQRAIEAVSRQEGS